MKRILLTISAAIVATSLWAATPVEAYFTVNPKMSCANCEKKIKSNLRYEKGVKSITTSIPDQLVTIKYDSEKTDPAKIAEAFKRIGYTATRLSANPKAADKADAKAAKEVK